MSSKVDNRNIDELLKLLQFPYAYPSDKEEVSPAFYTGIINYHSARREEFNNFRIHIERLFIKVIFDINKLSQSKVNSEKLLKVLKVALAIQIRSKTISAMWERKYGKHVRYPYSIERRTGLYTNQCLEEELACLAGDDCKNAKIKEALPIDIFISVYYDFFKLQIAKTALLIECLRDDSFNIDEGEKLLDESVGKKVDYLDLRMNKKELASLLLLLDEAGFIKDMQNVDLATFSEAHIRLFDKTKRVYNSPKDMKVELGRLSKSNSANRFKGFSELMEKLQEITDNQL